MQPIIEISKLSKKYNFGIRQPYLTLRDVIVSMGTNIRGLMGEWSAQGSHLQKDEFWALKNLSFDVMPGEIIGVIGPNGSGKSTLLKILSRITTPTEGTIKLRGRVASLLEVGTGFSPELTGRENIYLNGAILGMRQKEIRQKFDEIVAFAEVEKFIDTVVKHYSSGMYMRLAFAVAAHLDSEILLVDEVLAVGDSAFQQKCLGKMRDVVATGRTVVFVSHNMLAVSSICKRVIYLKNGKIVLDGGAQSVIGRYLGVTGKIAHKRFTEKKGREVSILGIEIRNSDGHPETTFGLDDDINIKINYCVARSVENTQIVLYIRTVKDILVLSTADIDKQAELFKKREAGHFKATLLIPKNILAPGEYKIVVACGIPDTKLIDEEVGPSFEISAVGSYAARWSTGRRGAILALPQSWLTEKI